MPRRSASTAPSGWRLSDRFQLPRIKAGALNVASRNTEEPFALLGFQFTHHLARRADDEHAVGNLFSLGDERVGADQDALADLCSVQHDAVDPDERAFADRAAMEHHLMADAYVAAERHRITGIDVQHGGVLHIAAFADRDAIVLRANHHV